MFSCHFHCMHVFVLFFAFFWKIYFWQPFCCLFHMFIVFVYFCGNQYFHYFHSFAIVSPGLWRTQWLPRRGCLRRVQRDLPWSANRLSWCEDTVGVYFCDCTTFTNQPRFFLLSSFSSDSSPFVVIFAIRVNFTPNFFYFLSYFFVCSFFGWTTPILDAPTQTFAFN